MGDIDNPLDVGFCLEALDRAIRKGCPKIFNTDQGAQFTSNAFTGKLDGAGVRISMDGRGRVFDNIFIERLWRSVKHAFLKNLYDSIVFYRVSLKNTEHFILNNLFFRRSCLIESP